MLYSSDYINFNLACFYTTVIGIYLVLEYAIAILCHVWFRYKQFCVVYWFIRYYPLSHVHNMYM